MNYQLLRCRFYPSCLYPVKFDFNIRCTLYVWRSATTPWLGVDGSGVNNTTRGAGLHSIVLSHQQPVSTSLKNTNQALAWCHHMLSFGRSCRHAAGTGSNDNECVPKRWWLQWRLVHQQFLNGYPSRTSQDLPWCSQNRNSVYIFNMIFHNKSRLSPKGLSKDLFISSASKLWSLKCSF